MTTPNRPARPTAAETNMHAEGAEFLVLGNLLIRGIHATKAYTRYPGWDVLATDTVTGRSCKIQVKARLATDYDGGFPIRSFDADFVVHVALNRGYRYSRRRSAVARQTDLGEREPDFFVLPMNVVRETSTSAPSWGKSTKVYMRRSIADWQQYRGAWKLIEQYLRG
jgi:hypothetical protein